MLPSRREFVRQLTVAGTVTLAGPALRGAEPADAGFALRLAPAQARIRRVAAVVNRRLPAVRARILAEAAEALRGRLLLPGSAEPTFVGSPPAWTTPRHNDQEFLWTLNRMGHWPALLRAHALTGEARYAAQVVQELDDWLVTAAPPADRHATGRIDFDFFADRAPAPWRSLEVGMRMYGAWPLVCEHLAGTPFLPPERRARLAASAALHAELLAVIPARKWPDADHNHYFMETLGLLAVARYFPELPPATTWQTTALAGLERCVENQFSADGGHVEGCPNYHNLCVELLGRFVSLADALGAPLAATTRRRCAAAAEHTVHATRTNGTIVPWGDSSPDENWVTALVWATRATGETVCAQQMAGVLGPDTAVTKFGGELWTLDDPDGFLDRLAQAPRPPLRRWRHDRGNDQAMARSSWDRDALSVFVACHSPLHPKSGHQHADLGGFELSAFGRPLVVDPGPFTYREGDDRRMFKSAQYHSVLTVDHREPFEYLNRWRYGPQQEGRISAVTEQDGVVRIESFHRNYAPAVCHRTLALVADRCLVVIDAVTGLSPEATIQIHTHVDFPTVAWDERERRAVATHASGGLAVVASAGLSCDFLPGRVSERFDHARPSTRIRFQDRGGPARRTYASILIPFVGGARRPHVADVTFSATANICHFTLNGAAHAIPFAAPRA